MVRFYLNSIGRRRYFGQTDILLVALEKYLQPLYKNILRIRVNEIGEKLADQYGVKHLPSDFKKKGGYLRSIALSEEYHLYRQNYCGCVFSKKNPDL